MNEGRFAVFKFNAQKNAATSHEFVGAVNDVSQLGSHLVNGSVHDVLDILTLKHWIISQVNGHLISIDLSAIGTNPYAFVGKRAA